MADRSSAGSSASYGDASPIAAFASAPGRSALTLIRCSGSGTLELFAAAFSAGGKLLAANGNTVLHGWIVTPATAQKIDEVLVSVFRGPKSYTGE
ncbi:MAG: tRNA uridine-5-carboxymethylaminomethyl(34) synthesis GTPase MnmE, partial [Treponema sp.]|nr:tRNA uridine-5-carboxymethylaminomethyl(34) synthesis GTPase MnmE [Treponema sp.]